MTRIPTDLRVFLDCKEVTNFTCEECRIVGAGSVQASKLLKRYDDFTGRITLTRGQCLRLLWSMVKFLLRR